MAPVHLQRSRAVIDAFGLSGIRAILLGTEPFTLDGDRPRRAPWTGSVVRTSDVVTVVAIGARGTLASRVAALTAAIPTADVVPAPAPLERL